jgi:hypothetical protein
MLQRKRNKAKGTYGHTSTGKSQGLRKKKAQRKKGIK